MFFGREWTFKCGFGKKWTFLRALWEILDFLPCFIRRKWTFLRDFWEKVDSLACFLSENGLFFLANMSKIVDNLGQFGTKGGGWCFRAPSTPHGYRSAGTAVQLYIYTLLECLKAT